MSATALTADDRLKLELAGLIKPDAEIIDPETTWFAVFRGKTCIAYFMLRGLAEEWQKSAPHRAEDRIVECRLRLEAPKRPLPMHIIAPQPSEPCFKSTPGPRQGVEYKSPYRHGGGRRK